MIITIGTETTVNGMKYQARVSVDALDWDKPGYRENAYDRLRMMLADGIMKDLKIDTYIV